MLGVFKDHVNGLVLQHDLAELNDIDILDFAIELHRCKSMRIY